VSARLTILGGKRTGEVLDLEPGTYQVGTGRAADIQLRDKGVGFKHAELTVGGDGQVFILDHKSRGGTFVNDEKVEPGKKVLLPGGDPFRIGTTELRLEATAAAEAKPAPAEPVPAEAKSEAAEPESEFVDEAPAAAEEPEPVEEVEEAPAAVEEAPAAVEEAPAAEVVEEAPPVDDAPDPMGAMDMAPPAYGDDIPSAAPEPTPADPQLEAALASDDTNLLKQQLSRIASKLASKTQEAAALTKALEMQAEADPSSSGAVASYGASIDEEYKTQILDLQAALQEESAKVFQREEEVRVLTGRINDLSGKHKGELKRGEEHTQSLEDSLEKAYVEIADLRKTLEKETNLETLEEVNANLLDENETLKEELDALKYQIEEEQSKRGALVRNRVSELRQETARIEDSNAEMRTLVEAYEEKIDELDERLEELEGENEALQSLVEDLRLDLAKTKKERETMVKTLRKKLKAMELRLEETRSAQARSSSEQRQAV
jgi:pSer/pThr/pTyr-binding forkhead associated (FHA) protein